MNAARTTLARPLVVLLLGFALAGPTRADPVTDLLFADGVLHTLPGGQEVRYAHTRRGGAAPEFQPVTDGAMLLAPGSDGLVRLTLVADGRSRTLPDFSVQGGNPVLLVFLESVVRTMAAETGGSPFYIRNRLKDALGAGGETAAVDQPLGSDTVTARALTLRPFQADPNRARMGAFADLTLRFVVSDAVPGRILSLDAKTAAADGGYHETITLTDGGKDSE